MTAQEQVEHRNLVIEEKEMEGKERTPPAPEASNLREEFQKGAGKEDSRNKSFAPRDERNRLTLFVLSAMSAFFFVGATLGFGPMQLMVSNTRSDRSVHT